MELPEWQEEQYQGLLTSNIWKSNVQEIKKVLSIPELKQAAYTHLLSPSIFSVSIKNIIPSIKLFEEYGIGQFITNRCLRRNVKLQKQLLEYLVNNNIDLVVEKKAGGYSINPILNASNTELKKKYDIDIKNLTSKGAKKKWKKY